MKTVSTTLKDYLDHAIIHPVPIVQISTQAGEKFYFTTSTSRTVDGQVHLDYIRDGSLRLPIFSGNYESQCSFELLQPAADQIMDYSIIGATVDVYCVFDDDLVASERLHLWRGIVARAQESPRGVVIAAAASQWKGINLPPVLYLDASINTNMPLRNLGLPMPITIGDMSSYAAKDPFMAWAPLISETGYNVLLIGVDPDRTYYTLNQIPRSMGWWDPRDREMRSAQPSHSYISGNRGVFALTSTSEDREGYVRMKGYKDLASNYIDGDTVSGTSGKLLQHPAEVIPALLRDKRIGANLKTAQVALNPSLATLKTQIGASAKLNGQVLEKMTPDGLIGLCRDFNILASEHAGTVTLQHESATPVALFTDTHNIIDVESVVHDGAQIANTITLRYRYSRPLGRYTRIISRNPANDTQCAASKTKYGHRYLTKDLTLVSDSTTAGIIANNYRDRLTVPQVQATLIVPNLLYLETGDVIAIDSRFVESAEVLGQTTSTIYRTDSIANLLVKTNLSAIPGNSDFVFLEGDNDNLLEIIGNKDGQVGARGMLNTRPRTIPSGVQVKKISDFWVIEKSQIVSQKLLKITARKL